MPPPPDLNLPDQSFLPRGFWVGQVLGWGVLAATLTVVTQPVLGPLTGLGLGPLFLKSAIWSVEGFAISSVLAWVYRPLLLDARLGLAVGLRVLVGCLGAAAVWSVLVGLGGDPFRTRLPHRDPPGEPGRERPPPPSDLDLPHHDGVDAPRGWPPMAPPELRDTVGRPPFRQLTPMPPLFLCLIAWSGLLLAVSHAQRLQRTREEVLRAEALAAEARFQMLRYELNPHFLFNSLNSIVGAIDEDPHRAKQMVILLSDLFRFTLRGSSREATVAEELEVCRTYLAIEATRFEERLQVDWQVDPSTLGLKVPPMLLQPLVENAVKHGMATSPMPLCITIGVGPGGPDLNIRVSNTGTLREGSEGEGIGLRNLRERLHHAYGGRASLTIGQESSRVVVALNLPMGGPR